MRRSSSRCSSVRRRTAATTTARDRQTPPLLAIAWLLALELFVLPQLLGWAIDAATLELFGASAASRVALLRSIPLVALALHWLVGFGFMVATTLVASELRRVLHPELCVVRSFALLRRRARVCVCCCCCFLLCLARCPLRPRGAHVCEPSPAAAKRQRVQTCHPATPGCVGVGDGRLPALLPRDGDLDEQPLQQLAAKPLVHHIARRVDPSVFGVACDGRRRAANRSSV